MHPFEIPINEADEMLKAHYPNIPIGPALFTLTQASGQIWGRIKSIDVPAKVAICMVTPLIAGGGEYQLNNVAHIPLIVLNDFSLTSWDSVTQEYQDTVRIYDIYHGT